MTNTTKYFQEVTQKATRSMGWNYLSFGLGKILSLLTVSILAHLLAPEYFGVVALATLTMDYLSVINDLGLGAALIQSKHTVDESANTAFIMNLFSSSILAIITVFAAPLAAKFFREPQVIPVLRWLGLTFPLAAIGSTHNILLQRELNFRKKIIPDLGNTISKAIISIGLALSGFGVWSLVIGQLVGTGISSILLWLVLPWRPRLSWDAGIAKELFRYGISIMGNNALSIWEDSFDYLVIGRIYSSTALGIYALAYRLPQMLVINVLWVMTSVLFPTFSSLQDDIEALKKSFLTIVRYVEVLVVPICFGMFIAADPIIRVIFGEQWVEAIPILRILSLYALVISIGFHAGDIYKAIGRPDILIKITIPIFIIRIIALWIGAQYSLVGVAIAHLAVILISITVNLSVASCILQVTIFEIIHELKAFLAGIVLIGFALLALHFSSNAPAVVQLIIVIIAGGIGYLGTIWLIQRDSIMRAIQMVGIKRPGPGEI